MKNLHILAVATAFFIVLISACDQKTKYQRKVVRAKILSGQHYDEGPADRYKYPFEPVTYNQEVLAPLPGLYYCYKMVDWDKDGLIDILGLSRRGAGIRFIKNVGSKQQPLFKSLQENKKIVGSGHFKRWFDVLDYNRDGLWDLIGWYVHPHKENDILSLNIYQNIGSSEKPKWDTLKAEYPNGEMIDFGGRVEVADWDDDGKEDIIIARSNMGRILKSDREKNENYPQRSKKYGGFRDTTMYDPMVGEFFFLKNISDSREKPVFSKPEPIKVNGERFLCYVGLSIGI